MTQARNVIVLYVSFGSGTEIMFRGPSGKEIVTTNRGVGIADAKKLSQRLTLVIGGGVMAMALLLASPAGMASAAPALVNSTGIAARGGGLLNDENGILPGKGNGSGALKQGQAVGKFVQRVVGAARTACNVVPAACTGPPPAGQNGG